MPAPQSSDDRLWVDKGLDKYGSGDYAGAVDAFRQALLIEGDSTDILLKLGAALSAAGQGEAAIGQYHAILEREPDHPGALSNLGAALVRAGCYAEAVESLTRAVAIRPDSGLSHFNLGVALQATDRLEDAVRAYRAAQRDRGMSVRTAANLGSVLGQLGRHEEALQVYDTALAAAPDDPNLHWNRATTHLLLGHYALGWQDYEWRWRTPARAPRHGATPTWSGGPLDGARILLHAEQGFGDTIQFARYAPAVAARGGRVILEVQPALKRLFGGFPGVEAVHAVGEDLPSFDLQCPLLGLPLRIGGIPPAIPYPALPAGGRQDWRNPDRQGDLHVGLVWAGSPTNGVDRRRSLDPAQLEPLLRVDRAVFVSLQAGAAGEKLDMFGASVIDPMPAVRDFADTAAIIAALDLVIAVDTAVAHLAGTLGKPVWLLNRFDSCWRWQRDREDTPWYRTMRIFRQPQPGDWATPVNRAAAVLAALALASSQSGR